MVGLAVSGEPQTVPGGFLLPKPQESLNLVSLFHFPEESLPLAHFTSLQKKAGGYRLHTIGRERQRTELRVAGLRAQKAAVLLQGELSGYRARTSGTE